MTSEELLSIVERRGHSARIRGDEVLIESCLFCLNSRSNLELNAAKGVYKCWACTESGTLQSLLREFFDYDSYVSVNLEDDEREYASFSPVVFGNSFRSASAVTSAAEWLKARHISLRDIRRFNILVGVKEDHPHYGRIVFPLKEYWTGEYAGLNSRKYGSAWGVKYLIDLENKVPVGYRSPEFPHIHVVVEGILDAIRVNQAGYNAYLLLGTGSDEIYEEWVATVPKENTIVLFLDGDKAGRERANALKHITATIRDEPTVLSLPETMDPGILAPDVLRMFLTRELHG